MIAPIPINNAFGKFFAGSFISSAREFKLVQPSYAHRVATVANAIIPIISLKLTFPLPAGIKLKSGLSLPNRSAPNIIKKIGINFAIIEIFCNIFPCLIPSELYAVNPTINAIAITFIAKSDNEKYPLNAVGSAMATAEIDPAPLSSQLVKPNI